MFVIAGLSTIVAVYGIVHKVMDGNYDLDPYTHFKKHRNTKRK